MSYPAEADVRLMPSSARPFSPRLMADIELTEPLADLRGDRAVAWILVRFCTEPIGVLEVSVPATGMPAAVLADRVWTALRTAIEARLVGACVPLSRLETPGYPAAPATSPYLRRRALLLRDAPPISVIVCTRDRADRLESCLDRLAVQSYPSYEIVVVDNAPLTDAVRRIVQRRPHSPEIRYVVEPVPGLSRARNRGVVVARHDLLAFLDDDEAADQHWLAEIMCGFAAGNDIGCVTGLILPLRLDTREQEWFEQFGGHSKGRGFSSVVLARNGTQSPLYPLPAFGAGGNMAFRRSVLERINGFDVALGSGTPARGGEDTLAFTRVLLAGYRLAYQPSALVRHDHYSDMAGLTAQLRGYGTGLTAYYAALLRWRPSLFFPMLRLLPTAVTDMRGKDSIRTERMKDFPSELIWAQRRGMLVGACAYRKWRSNSVAQGLAT